MNYQSMIKVIAGTGLIFSSLNVSAGGFGGGWMHDSTGTLSYSNVKTVKSSTPSQGGYESSGFGGGWKHDSTGTLYYSKIPAVKGSAPSTGYSKGSGFGGNWAHDSSGTLTRHM